MNCGLMHKEEEKAWWFHLVIIGLFSKGLVGLPRPSINKNIYFENIFDLFIDVIF